MLWGFEMSPQTKALRIEVGRMWGLYLEICLRTYNDIKLFLLWCWELTSEMCPRILNTSFSAQDCLSVNVQVYNVRILYNSSLKLSAKGSNF
jgi:hypothetical protein